MLKLTSLLLVILSINVLNGQEDANVATSNIENVVNKIVNNNDEIKSIKKPKQIINHYLKWITNQTKFPMKLTIPIDPSEILNDTYSWDWLRLKDESLITHLPTLFKDYVVTETEKEANLYLMKYAYDTHEHLASYEPILVHTDESTKNLNIIDNKNNLKHVFSLAYLAKHTAKIDESTNQLKCYADFLVAKPNTNKSSTHSNFLKSIMNQMEHTSKFTLRYKEIGSNLMRSFENSFSKIFGDNFHYKDEHATFESTNSQPKPSHPTSIPQQSQNNNQQQFLQPAQQQYQQLIANQVNRQPYIPSNLQSQMVMNGYGPWPNSFSLDHLHRTFNPRYQAAALAAAQQQAMLLSSMPLIRYKRNNDEEEIKAIETQREDENYDSENFFKIRLSVGPLSIKEHLLNKKIDLVECSLTMTSLGDAPFQLSTVKEPIRSHEINDFISFYAPNYESSLFVNHQNNMQVNQPVSPLPLPSPQLPQFEIPDQKYSDESKSIEHKPDESSNKESILFLIDSEKKKAEENRNYTKIKLTPVAASQYSSSSSFDKNLIVLIICFLNAMFSFYF